MDKETLTIKEKGINFPFNPAKIPIFYGWVILFIGAAGILMSIPGQTMGVSVFTGNLVHALGISRMNLSIAYMIGTVLSSLLLSRAGEFYDRYGARITMLLAGIVLALVLFFFSRIDHIAFSLADREKVSGKVIPFILLVFGFFLLRYSGQGVMTMVSRSMIMKWFDQRRGIAAAILGIFTSFGFSYAPRVMDRMIGHSNWRHAWVQLGIVCGIVFGVIAFLLYRDNPGVCGLNPDSLKELKPDPNLKKRSEGVDFTLKEAKKVPILWFFSLALALWAMFNTAFTFHVVSIFKQADWSREQALSIFFPISIVSVASRFLVSAVSDRLRLEWIYLIYLIGMAMGALSLILLQWTGVLWILVPGMGIAGGIFGTLNSISWVRLFGKAHLGAISGFAMGWVVAGSAVGPYFFSLSERIWGSYNGGAWLTLAICLLLTGYIFFKSLFSGKQKSLSP